ncbi:MAG: hypothetical protein IPP80_01840 [Ignavibacteria bacterium]|nr:hypothetical protein [Ignavibacteria bacterium]
MAGSTGNKLFKIASQINIGRDAIVEYLASKGHKIENKATTVLSDEQSDLVIEKFAKELKTAQKQREKVQRQQQVRKTQLEQGSAVSIDTIAEAHEREREIEERLERPADSHTEETPQVEAAAPVAPPPAAPVVVAEAPAAPVVAEVPEPPTAPEAAPVVAETPAPAAVPEPVPTPAPEPESTGPAVGAVIDLSAIGKPKEEPKPTPPPLPKQTAKSTPPSKAVPAPAAPVAPPVAEEAAPAEAAAPVEGANQQLPENKVTEQRQNASARA